MVELQPSKLVMGVRFPSPALRSGAAERALPSRDVISLPPKRPSIGSRVVGREEAPATSNVPRDISRLIRSLERSAFPRKGVSILIRRRGILIAIALLVIGIFTATAAMAGSKTRYLITAKGTENMDPNALIYSDFHFDPGTLIVHSGDVIRFIKDEGSEDPHTLTIVDKAQLPKNFYQVLAEHFPPNGNVVKRVDPDGDGGLDQSGDSILIFPPEQGQGISARITAPAGTNLYFLCSIHPWMQGKIEVTG